MIEAPEELDVPRLGFGDRELRERGIRVDERLARDARVLVAPEPRAAREIQEEIRVGAILPHVARAAAVIGAVVVHERPAIAETERLERLADVVGSVTRIRGARVLDRIVDALARVLDVEDLVPERTKAKQIHQRAPGDAAEWIARDDPCKQDPHGGKGGYFLAASISSSTLSGSSSDLPTESRAHIRR